MVTRLSYRLYFREIIKEILSKQNFDYYRKANRIKCANALSLSMAAINQYQVSCLKEMTQVDVGLRIYFSILLLRIVIFNRNTDC